MKNDDMELIHGSGNIFRDFGHPNADLELFRALLASAIIKALDRQKLTVRAAAAKTKVAAADFSRIRQCDLKRFTVDRLMMILNRLGSQVDVKIKVRAVKKDSRVAA